MNPNDGKATALHIATYSGWYRFVEQHGQWTQTNKALSFWKMTSLQVDPADAGHIYVATEHSGLFVTHNGGAEWQRAKPNVPRLTTNSLCRARFSRARGRRRFIECRAAVVGKN